MKMEYNAESNRVGIYTQTSIEAAAIGAGFAPQGEKSPAASREYNLYMSESSEYGYGESMGNVSVSSDTMHSDQRSYESFENPFKKNISFDDFQRFGGGKTKGKKGKKAKRKSSYLGQDYVQEKKQKGSDPLKQIPSSVKQFPQAEEFFGKQRWQQALAMLKRIGYVTWEINTMFGKLDSMVRQGELENVDRPDLPEVEPPPPKPFFESKKLIESKQAIVPKNPIPIQPKGAERFVDDDLRVNIGDASSPDFGIPPEHRKELIYQLIVLMKDHNRMSKKHNRVDTGNYLYTNRTLLVMCKNENTVSFIRNNLHKLCKLWEGARLVVRPRIASRKKIRIWIPFCDMETKEILTFISKQNTVDIGPWHVTERLDENDKVRLDVVVDAKTYLRFFKDQDEMYFFLSRATLKELPDC